MERQDIRNAETAYINAKQPQQAVQAWMSIKNYNEALRVAKQQGLHQMIQQINAIYSGGGRQGASAEEIYNSAKTWEESNNFA